MLAMHGNTNVKFTIVELYVNDYKAKYMYIKAVH